MAKRNALGKGLGALIDAPALTTISQSEESNINNIDIQNITINPYQPRSYFNEEALDELSISIKELGMIQPITLRKIGDKKYQLISGERRLRAATLAGLITVPAYIREASDTGMVEMALVENIQREDLDAIEIALSFNRLIEECKLTQQEMSKRVGKKRSTITNYLRLLKLPPIIQKGIKNRSISMGHARTLITLPNEETQISICEQIIENNLSVRETENIVNKLDKPQKIDTTNNKTDDYANIKQQIENLFQSEIKFKRNAKGKGKIEIVFSSDNELERIISLLDKLNNDK